MSMFEAEVVIPKFDNSGTGTENVVPEAILTPAIKRWGGATIVDACGGFWICPEGHLHVEPIAIMKVAMEPTPENDDAWRVLALRMGLATKQKSVYCKLASGAVEFLDPANAEAHLVA